MLWTPQKGAMRMISNLGIVGTATPGTALVSSGTTLLDGAVTEIISAANNNQNSWGIAIQFFASTVSPSTLASEGCVDILIGGATDDVLIPALIAGHVGLDLGIGYFFPLHIPQSLRIAARYANVKVSHSIQCVIHLYGGPPPPWRVGNRVITYGTQVNNARGQAVTPTASGGAASVTVITAGGGTTQDHFAFMPGFQPETDTTVTQKSYNIGIGVGASVEERIGTWIYNFTANEEARGPIPAFAIWRDVPAGTQLSMLASNSGTNDAAYGGLIYAVC